MTPVKYLAEPKMEPVTQRKQTQKYWDNQFDSIWNIILGKNARIWEVSMVDPALPVSECAA